MVVSKQTGLWFLILNNLPLLPISNVISATNMGLALQGHFVWFDNCKSCCNISHIRFKYSSLLIAKVKKDQTLFIFNMNSKVYVSTSSFIHYSEYESTELGMQPSLDCQMRANGTNIAPFHPHTQDSFSHMPLRR